MPLVLSFSVVVLTLTTFLASLPWVAHQPSTSRKSEWSGTSAPARWLVVRSLGRSWYLNGQPMSAAVLSRQLDQRADRPDELVLLPSSALPASEVASDLAWLRRQSSIPVRLQGGTEVLAP